MVSSPKLFKNETKFNVLDSSTLLSLIKTKGIVEPLEPELLSCNGLDLRLANDYVRLRKTGKIFDTHGKNSLDRYFLAEKNPNLLIGPNEKVLVCTIERLRMPKNVMGLVGLRSTYSRLGLQMPLGFIDPGFVGQLTLEISGGSFPVLLHLGDRVFHVVVALLNGPSERSYDGKYQNQKGVTLPIFSGSKL
jgi:dCTP deaminase